jgi:hypothetical protein
MKYRRFAFNIHVFTENRNKLYSIESCGQRPLFLLLFEGSSVIKKTAWLTFLAFLFLYNNSAVLSYPRIGRRNRGRPRRRWKQEFREVVGNHWSRIEGDRRKWKYAFLDIH